MLVLGRVKKHHWKPCQPFVPSSVSCKVGMGDAITAITLAGSLFDGSLGGFWNTKTRETNGEAEEWTPF